MLIAAENAIVEQPPKPSRKKTLLSSTFSFSFMTAISRVTGFLRDLVFAHVFGATAGLDAFLVAFKIPNFLRRLFAEGAFSQAFVPILSEYRQNKSHEEIQIFLNRVAGVITTVLFIVTVIAVLITPWLIWIFAPGFVRDPTRLALATAMLRITFPYILFISLTAYVSGILNSYGRFAIPAFTPNLLNLALIGAAIFLAPHFQQPIKALAWGVFIGGVAQLLFQLPFLKKLNLMPRPQLLWRDPGVKRVIKLMVPAMLGVSVEQISLLVDTLFASFLRVGSLSWLYYSDRLTSFPLGVFGIAVSTVILPHLSRKYAKKSNQEFTAALDWAIKFILLVALPAAVGLVILAGPILSTLLQYGEFAGFDVVMVRKSLIPMAVAIPAFMLIKIFASGFYSRQNIKTPVRIAITCLTINMCLDAALIYPLGYVGLAISTAITSSLNAVFLFIMLLKHNYYQFKFNTWRKFFWQLSLANLGMGTFLILTTAKLNIWLKWHWLDRAWHLGILLAIAIVIYLGLLLISGVRWRDFLLSEQ